jgi:hypothetical protein
LVIREFSFLGWNGQGNWQLEVQRIPKRIQARSGAPAGLAGPFCIAGGYALFIRKPFRIYDVVDLVARVVSAAGTP